MRRKDVITVVGGIIASCVALVPKPFNSKILNRVKVVDIKHQKIDVHELLFFDLGCVMMGETIPKK